jgi:hypothetical protein
MTNPRSWRDWLLTAFVTFHIVCVTLYALPRPPGGWESQLEHPEVKGELEKLHDAIPWRNTAREQKEDLVAVTRACVHFTNRMRRLAEPYLMAVGSDQAWHMFGGTPPRSPLLLVVEVRPEGEVQFQLFQDLRWGTADSAAMNFRHRKVHEHLGVTSSAVVWRAYAEYWKRRWDALHPADPARQVRLSFTRLHTLPPEEVRAGGADRRAERGLESFVWP